MLITGYRISSENSNKQLKTIASDKQNLQIATRTYPQAEVSQHNIYVKQFKYANAVVTVSCKSNDLICGYI